jgi:EmrB/QacA subfamily drug resistance transporter
MTRYLIFATVSLSLLLSGIGGTSVAVALEAIRADFGVSVVLVGWVIGAFQLAVTVSMPISGKVCDVLGRKPTFMLCVGLFIVGSLCAAMAPNMALLIAARLVQALGAGGFMPAAVGIVAEVFPHSRQRAIGLFSSIFPIGQIAGPVLGGWLIQSFGWRSAFWLNVPVGLAALILAALLLRPGGRQKGQIDLAGAGLVSACLASLMGGLSLVGYATTSQSWLLVALLFATAGALMVLFLRHESRAPDPIIDVQILRERPFLAANIFNLVYGAGVLGVMSLVPLFSINVYGVSYLESGLILTPRAVGMFVTSLVVSMFMMRWGYRRPILAGAGLTMLSLVLLSLEPKHLTMLGQGLDSITVLSLIMLLMGMGVGLSAPASNNACIELMPERAATITGIRGMFRQAGGAISVTMATLVLHQSADAATGFRIVFIALAVVMLATLPAIFAMPRSPTDTAFRRPDVRT